MRVVNGTPIHGESLCLTCDNAHIINGQAVGQQIIICNFSRSMRMKFPVASCSAYNPRGTMTLHSMYQMAFILESKEGKYGFRRPTEGERRWGSGLDGE